MQSACAALHCVHLTVLACNRSLNVPASITDSAILSVSTRILPGYIYGGSDGKIATTNHKAYVLFRLINDILIFVYKPVKTNYQFIVSYF